MKNNRYKNILMMLPLALLLVVVTNRVQAQDTLIVEWLDGDNLLNNSLFEAIISDTVAGGERANANRVYKLRQGGFYYVTETIINVNYPLTIVGEKGDPSDEFANPPMIQISAREDGSTPGKMFTPQGNFTLKNVIINGKTTLGALPYELINPTVAAGRFIFDNVIFEYAQWGIMGIYSKDADIFFTNCTWRNLISETQPWGGRGFSVWQDADTVLVENNTFSNVGGFALQVEGGSVNHFIVNQNTFVNNGRQIVLAAWAKNFYFTNNLVLNPFWQGESSMEISADRQESTDEQFAGLFNIENLPSEYGLDIERKIVIANNVFFTESIYTDFFTTDNDTFPIRRQPLLNVRIQNIFDENPNMIVANNSFDEANPNFTTYPDNHAERVTFITAIRRGTSPIPTHYWDPNRDDSNESIQWPLPEDLTYANNDYKTMALGGYPVGDLNWYPSEKASWQANKASQYDAIQELFSGDVTVEFVKAVQAENGTYSGDAKTGQPKDRYAVRFTAGPGEAKWTPTISDAAAYDIVVRARTWYADTNPGRQTNISVNGTVSTFDYGVNGPAWNDIVLEDIDLVAGENEVILIKNWGFMEYESVIIKDQAGNIVSSLSASTATLTDAQLSGEGFLAFGDAFAELTGGGVSIPVTLDNAGNYTAKLTFFVPGGGDATADISVNGTLASGSQTFTSEDSTWAEINLSNLAMNSGSNTITINNVAGNLVVDKVDLFIVSTSGNTSVATEELPDNFKLNQNYPNPFNPSTTIGFVLPNAGNVQIDVYSILGARVAVLVNQPMMAGSHSINFNASSLASGIYIYRLRFNNQSIQRRMTLIK